MPLSAIFTPATISVSPRIHSSSVSTNVSQRDHFLANSISRSTDGSWQYPGVSTMLNYLSQLTLVEANLLPVSGGSPGQNLSYSQSFHGPAVQCLPPADETRTFILSAMEESINETEEFLFWTSFYPYEDFGPNMNGTFFTNIVASESATDPNLGLDLISKDAAKVYHTLWVDNDMTTLPNVSSGYMEILECSLHNASYNVQFELGGDGQQSVSATRTLLEPMPATLALPSDMSEYDASGVFEYYTLMQSYVVYVIGATTTAPLYTSKWEATQFSSLVASPVLMSYLLPSMNPIDFGQFKSGLEDLFQNFTLSYRFGEVPDSTLADSNQFNSDVSAPAILRRSLNTFTYNPRTLLIAYGIAILLAAACLACGLAALYSNGVSYTNNFSTVLRMTRDHRFDEFVRDEEDRSGADPLPQHIADVVVTYVRETEKGGGEDLIGGIKVLRQA